MDESAEKPVTLVVRAEDYFGYDIAERFSKGGLKLSISQIRRDNCWDELDQLGPLSGPSLVSIVMLLNYQKGSKYYN